MGSSRTYLLAFVLATSSGAEAQQPLDAQVAKGIQQLEAGDAPGAILTLDAAVRRLATVMRPRDLAQANLHLGVAYVAEGQETLAKARFRDAVAQASDLSLDAKRWPKAAELLEQAKRDAAARAASSGGGGRKVGQVLLGAGAVTAGAVAIALTAADKPEIDFSRYYGTFANLAFAPSIAGCTAVTVTLELAGNADGSNFRINQVFTPAGSAGPLLLTGTLEATGHFTVSGGGYAIVGQTTGSRVAGTETRTAGGPACAWMFDGTR